jgi:hypothetical protein
LHVVRSFLGVNLTARFLARRYVDLKQTCSAVCR